MSDIENTEVTLALALLEAAFRTTDMTDGLSKWCLECGGDVLHSTACSKCKGADVSVLHALEQFRPALAKVKADAWDEGHEAGNADWPACAIACGGCNECMADDEHPNPYRAEAT